MKGPSDHAEIEDLPRGQRDVLRTAWQDVHSADEVIREWGWVRISTVEAWITGAGEWSGDLGQELALLTELAQLIMRVQKMEEWA